MKKSANPVGRSSLNVQMSWSMGSKFAELTGGQSIEQTIKRTGVKLGVDFINGSLILNKSAVKRLFEPVTSQIIKIVEDLMSVRKLHPLSYFFLVGGFGESAYLQHNMNEHFAGRVAVLTPSEAQMSVIKGAVLFGHNPGEIRSRVARKTYGVATNMDFDPDIHDEKHLRVIEGVRKCSNLFRSFIRKDEEVEVGFERSLSFTPVTRNQTSMRFSFYCADFRPAPVQYVTDVGVTQLGEGVEVEMPDTEGGLRREVELCVTFGGTELQVSARDKTSGREAKTTLHFLAN